ncbi:MAG: LacI family DNA-binding transcriptional regulator [Bacillota bacterium]|uniref:Substrate-binding domain-containing protein n=1 Tax=Thermanaerosceptrum fracticalcis TaxID=1712410 RepID=A0A7G6E5E7_THEFR|nr:LacI family DNA-binding transcriptional regulator [Thermanaerosceptrum fracticalcis]QNB47301.1 substrate-binding domain-containing protein [Thermanaerosceptrum fracticalcis]
MTVTIKDIARAADVSIATVSRVLNNKADGITEETKAKIRKAVKELNYRPNAIARGLITKKTHTIGLVLPDISNPFFPEIARGVEDVAKEAGYNVFLCNTDDDSKKERGYVKALRERQVDGIIFTASALKNSEDITEHVGKMPFILVDRKPDNLPDAPGVFLDNLKGGYLAAKHLIEKGHREIALISGPLQSYNARQRLEGFKKALQEAGIRYKDKLIREGDYKRSGGYRAMEKLLREGVEFTAVFASNDLMAVGVMEMLREKGIAIPEQVAVVGFDNIYLSTVVAPRLTTISQPTYQMGAQAAQMLLTCLQGRELDEKQKVFSPQLIIRESS